MAGQNKDIGKDANRETGRDGKEARDVPGKNGKEKKDDALTRRLSQIADEVSALRQAVTALQDAAAAPPGNAPNAVSAPDAPLTLTDADDALVARIGYALGSGPKVSLARLLYTGGDQSASQLGEQAGLTTGSLYHHLRELMHAELIAQQTRNRYHLTERGRRALELLTPFAREGR